MFKTVMWATDGSEAADLALPLATALAKEGGHEVIVAHCEELTTPGKGGGALPVHANEDELKAKVEQQVAELANDGLRASVQMTRSRAGGAAHAIVDTATASGAEVIVVGTRGHTALGGLLLGSVTQRLLHIAPCPVLVVPANRAASV